MYDFSLFNISEQFKLLNFGIKNFIPWLFFIETFHFSLYAQNVQ